MLLGVAGHRWSMVKKKVFDQAGISATSSVSADHENPEQTHESGAQGGMIGLFTAVSQIEQVTSCNIVL